MKPRLSSLALLLLTAAPLAAQTWQQNANGQMLTDPCGGPIVYPNDSNWSQQEVISICGSGTNARSFLSQPSNWSTPLYPNSTGAAVVLNGPTVTNSNVDVLVNTVTIGPNGGLNMDTQGRITGQSLIIQRDLTISRNSSQGGFKGDIFLTNTLSKTSGSGAAIFEGVHDGGIALNLSGVIVDVQIGRIVLPGKGIINGATFRVASGSLVDMTGGNSNGGWGGAATGSGGGTVLFQSGVIAPSPFNLDQSARIPLILNFPGAMFQWTGGQFGSGTSTSSPFSNIGTINVAGAASKALLIPLTNSGTMNFSGGDFYIDQGTVIDNQATGTLNFGGDYFLRQGTQRGGAAPIVINRGLFVKSAGSGELKMEEFVGFSNRGGTVRVDAGTIRLGPAFNQDGGTFITAAGAVIDLTGGFSPGGNTAGFSGTYTGTGMGTVSIASGVFNTGGQDDGGNFLPGATLNFPGAMFQWSGGTINAGRSSALTNNGVINVSGPAGKTLYGVQLANNGTMNFSGGELFTDRTTITNAAAGVIDVRADGVSFTGYGNLDSAGTFVKSGGAGTVAFASTARDSRTSAAPCAPTRAPSSLARATTSAAATSPPPAR